MYPGDHLDGLNDRLAEEARFLTGLSELHVSSGPFGDRTRQRAIGNIWLARGKRFSAGMTIHPHRAWTAYA